MEDIEEFLSEAIYCIVAFEEHDVLGRKLIELVPKSWIGTDEEQNVFCYYPPSKMAGAYMTKWLKNLHPPEDSWSTYKIEIKYRAKDYNQGLRRLHRAFTSAQAASDPEDIYQPELRNHLVSEEIENFLNESSTLKLIQSQAPTCEELMDASTNNLTRTHENGEHFESGRKRKAISGNPSATAKKKCPPKVDDRLIELRNQMSSKQKIMADYIDLQMELMKKSITSAKRSILYDIKQRICSNTPNQPSNSREEIDNSWRPKIGIKLPISNPNDFLSFDADIRINIEKQAAVKKMCQNLTDGCMDYQRAVKMIMGEIITKDVQLLYSGAGRKIQNVGKLNFSDTGSYKLIEEFITEKYGNSNHQLKILTTVSTFLSGANDRDGGRAQRKQTS